MGSMLCTRRIVAVEITKSFGLVDLPYGKKAIGTKWVYQNKKDERGVVVRNKARLVAQGHRQEEGIDYDDIFASGGKDFETNKDLFGLCLIYRNPEEVDFANVKTASTPLRTQKPLVRLGKIIGEERFVHGKLGYNRGLDFDDIKARIEADRLLAEKLQEQEREQFTIEERAKFLHDTIAAQRKFLAQQRSEAIRNKPPTKNQLRNQMMTYLKHVGNYKHAELKIKKFEEVQALYEKIKRSDEDFISIGSAEDERLIKRMNEKGVDLSKSEVIKEESKEEVKEEDKDEESTRKRKLGTRKKMKSRKRRYIQNTSEDDSDKENDELRLYLTIAPDEEKEVDYEILDRKYPIKEWKTECFGTKPQSDQTEHLEEINLNVVIRSNGQKRHFSTLMSVLSIFDREDLDAVNQLVMDRFQDEMPEGFDRVLWGDLMVLFNSDDKDEFWGSQQDWKIESWKLHSSSGVHTLVTDTGLVIHMLVEKKYPLRKEVLMQMLKLKLESEEENTMALELIKFVKKILAELEPKEDSHMENAASVPMAIAEMEYCFHLLKPPYQPDNSFGSFEVKWWTFHEILVSALTDDGHSTSIIPLGFPFPLPPPFPFPFPATFSLPFPLPFPLLPSSPFWL
ncbi:ribonuclease H-like domain-containing protein [Tanacetum coccineum]